MREIKSFSLLVKKKNGEKICSRLLSRTLKHSGLSSLLRGLSNPELEDHLHKAFQDYYAMKSNHIELRKTYLEELAPVLAENQKQTKENIIRQLQHCKSQRNMARKLRYLRGKMNRNSTTMVTVEIASGELQDISDKKEMERAIMRNNEEKFRQSMHTPFFQPPLSSSFGYKGVTQAAAAVLAESNHTLDPAVHDMLNHLQMPYPIQEMGKIPMELTVESYCSFWKKANENISCTPRPMSFSTMKGRGGGNQ